MQRIANVDKWQKVRDGEAVNFGNVNGRRVRLEVNAPHETRLYYVDGNGEYTFLARVFGREAVEFAAVGEFTLLPEGGDVWFYTVDGQDFSFAKPDAETFTQIISRRPRNHEMELMLYLQNQNMERMLRAQRDEMEQLLAARTAVGASGGGQPAPSGSAGAAGSQ